MGWSILDLFPCMGLFSGGLIFGKCPKTEYKTWAIFGVLRFFKNVVRPFFENKSLFSESPCSTYYSNSTSRVQLSTYYIVIKVGRYYTWPLLSKISIDGTEAEFQLPPKRFT